MENQWLSLIAGLVGPGGLLVAWLGVLQYRRKARHRDHEDAAVERVSTPASPAGVGYGVEALVNLTNVVSRMGNDLDDANARIKNLETVHRSYGRLWDWGQDVVENWAHHRKNETAPVWPEGTVDPSTIMVRHHGARN